MSESLTNKVLELVSNLVVHSSINHDYSIVRAHRTKYKLADMFTLKKKNVLYLTKKKHII